MNLRCIILMVLCSFYCLASRAQEVKEQMERRMKNPNLKEDAGKADVWLLKEDRKIYIVDSSLPGSSGIHSTVQKVQLHAVLCRQRTKKSPSSKNGLLSK